MAKERAMEWGITPHPIPGYIPFGEPDGKRWTHDTANGLWYFDVRDDPKAVIPIAKTVDMGHRRVLIDYSESGEVVGVEVL